MRIAGIDWVIIACFFLFSLLMGVWASRRAGSRWQLTCRRSRHISTGRMVKEVLPDVPHAAPVCRAESWRGIPSASASSVSALSSMSCPNELRPWTRFQLPPPRTQHADFPHYALLITSHQGLCDLLAWEYFQLRLVVAHSHA